MRLRKLSLAVAACGALGSIAAGCPAPQDPVQLHGQVHLTLLHTADIHSRLFPYDLQISQSDAALGLGAAGSVVNVGGAARVSYIIGRERARAERVLHLDGGDCFQGAPIFNFFSGEAEVRSLAQMGTDAMVLANHEFDRGALNVANQLERWSSFPVLAANYKLDDPSIPGSPELGRVLSPFTTFNLNGLKVLVVGMGNLSSIVSLFDQPNSLGITPLNTAEVAQFYIDLMRPYVDLVVFVTHLGLEQDEQMIEHTTGIDVVLGGHNHIVLQPPKVVYDCHDTDADGHHYVDMADGAGQDPDDKSRPPSTFRRYCNPRPVLLAHSGAFAKYVGRLDLVVSDDPKDVGPGYDPADHFEVVSHDYHLFPVTSDVPEDPMMVSLLLPYEQALNTLVDLDLLVGYAPDGSKRSAPSGGDSALGNLIATAMWLRQGVKTDFSLTNTTGIRADMVPGPITIEQMFNIFPFDNSITKMQLSGVEIEQLFDFVARRSASRGCVSQAQIAGARVVLNCNGCTRSNAQVACSTTADCPSGATCLSTGQCSTQACAEHIYIGHSTTPCKTDADCNGERGSCDDQNADASGFGRCSLALDPIATYELATSNYLAAGGSGFRVLQRNTTQFDTKIQQRDALIDYIRQGHPCGWDPAIGDLHGCSTDADCAADQACACVGSTVADGAGACRTQGSCSPDQGRCVLRACRDDVAAFHRSRCAGATDPAACDARINSCEIAGEECKFLACVDHRLGNFADGRIDVGGP